jgi:hypothetical protein
MTNPDDETLPGTRYSNIEYKSFVEEEKRQRHCNELAQKASFLTVWMNEHVLLQNVSVDEVHLTTVSYLNALKPVLETLTIWHLAKQKIHQLKEGCSSIPLTEAAIDKVETDFVNASEMLETAFVVFLKSVGYQDK